MLVGAVLLRLTFTDTYRRYVRPEMGRWLTVAGIAVVVLGVVTLVRALRHGGAPAAHDADGHGRDHHDHGIGVGWLLLAPIAMISTPAISSHLPMPGCT